MRSISVVFLLTIFNMGCFIFNKYDTEQFKFQYPVTYEILKEDSTVLQNIITYAGILNSERRIRKLSQLENAYYYRDSIAIPALGWKLDNNLIYEKNREQLHNEFGQLGIHISAAEGIFGSVGPKLILEEKMDQLAPGDFKLYQEFLHFRSFIRDGEYPYVSMKEEVQMISIGEKFLSGISNSPYWQLIESDFYETLGNFLAIHKVIDEDTESYRIGGTNVAFWPFSTLMEDRKYFVETFPYSRFSSMVKEIISGPSTIDLRSKDLFIVVTDWNDNHDEAKEKRKDHFLNDKAIPHILEVKRSNGEVRVANVYRFYSDRSKAERSFNHIKKGGNNAEIIKVTEPGALILKEIK